ncbi:MAG: hypothetical protein AAB426_11820 [Myxococcota bacterium]
MRQTALWFALLANISCAHSLIQGTEVRDTRENREVYDVVQKLREGLTSRDADAVMALISEKYFETLGTTDPNDDYGYTALRDKVIPELFGAVQEMQLAFEVYEIDVEDDRAHVDVRYHARAQINLPSGTQWASNKEFNRIELVRDGDTWKIVSGL